ncbi:MAG: carbon storage regulator [Candidatus Acidulodesulfobacterium acidiphilum]|uniref:Translational regulator CsrA n=1 Tax=Candidatus Acidulodesulfobacterium acidiphilum TaxID=2597224 RepID=A0A520XDN3_9DELT|nr:MAG: carbon storage regulator [Candidatus Acidulodesulfobacterium acidiphilum]
MLILTRKAGESIKIGDDVTIEVLSMSGSSVKIGIDAPKSINILRKELYDIIKNENINASTVSLDDISGLNKLNELNELNNFDNFNKLNELNGIKNLNVLSSDKNKKI